MGSLPGTTIAAVISDVKSFLCKMNENSVVSIGQTTNGKFAAAVTAIQ